MPVVNHLYNSSSRNGPEIEACGTPQFIFPASERNILVSQKEASV